MFENYKVFNYEYAGRPLKVEVGKVAGLANGSCMISYGETVILACATASPKPRDGIDFLPLSVDYDEKLYAVGRIPGSFTRREGRPGEKAILTSRVIDRPIRPLFPKDIRCSLSRRRSASERRMESVMVHVHPKSCATMRAPRSFTTRMTLFIDG